MKIAEAGAKSLVAVDLSAEARKIYHQRYRATAREVDAALQQFFAALERQKLLENTVVIITSDHGESFGESDLITHMFGDRGDFESTHHVPMLILLPSKMRTTTKVIDRRVSIANLAPTIYDLAGLDWQDSESATNSTRVRRCPCFLTARSATPPRSGFRRPRARTTLTQNGNERRR